MELSIWNYQYGNINMEISIWNYQYGTINMEISIWKYQHGTIILELSLRNYHVTSHITTRQFTTQMTLYLIILRSFYVFKKKFCVLLHLYIYIICICYRTYFISGTCGPTYYHYIPIFNYLTRASSLGVGSCVM